MMAAKMPEFLALNVLASRIARVEIGVFGLVPANPKLLAASTLAVSAAFSTGVRTLRLATFQAGIHYAVGSSPVTATASSTWLPANRVVDIGVPASAVLSARASSGVLDSLSVVEMVEPS